MLQLSVVQYQVLLVYLDTYDTYAIAINKLCKLNFNVLSYMSAARLSGLVLI